MAKRTCDECGMAMKPYVPRKSKGDQKLCWACHDTPRGGYVSAEPKTAALEMPNCPGCGYPYNICDVRGHDDHEDMAEASHARGLHGACHPHGCSETVNKYVPDEHDHAVARGREDYGPCPAKGHNCSCEDCLEIKSKNKTLQPHQIGGEWKNPWGTFEAEPQMGGSHQLTWNSTFHEPRPDDFTRERLDPDEDPIRRLNSLDTEAVLHLHGATGQAWDMMDPQQVHRHLYVDHGHDPDSLPLDLRELKGLHDAAHGVPAQEDASRMHRHASAPSGWPRRGDQPTEEDYAHYRQQAAANPAPQVYPAKSVRRSSSRENGTTYDTVQHGHPDYDKKGAFHSPSPSDEYHGPYQVIQHPETGKYHVVDNQNRIAPYGPRNGMDHQDSAEERRDYCDSRQSSKEMAKGLADKIYNSTMDIMDPGGTEESRKTERHTDRLNDLAHRYEGGTHHPLSPGRFGAEDDMEEGDGEGEPYYEVQHPTGYTARDYGGANIHIGHVATPDQSHDLVQVDGSTPGGFSTPGTKPPGFGHEDLHRELHDWVQENAQYAEHHDPRIPPYMRQRGTTALLSVYGDEPEPIKQSLSAMGEGPFDRNDPDKVLGPKLPDEYPKPIGNWSTYGDGPDHEFYRPQKGEDRQQYRDRTYTDWSEQGPDYRRIHESQPITPPNPSGEFVPRKPVRTCADCKAAEGTIPMGGYKHYGPNHHICESCYGQSGWPDRVANDPVKGIGYQDGKQVPITYKNWPIDRVKRSLNSLQKTAGHAFVYVMGGAPEQGYPHAFHAQCTHPDHEERWGSETVHRDNELNGEGYSKAWDDVDAHNREAHTSSDASSAPDYSQDDPFSWKKSHDSAEDELGKWHAALPMVGVKIASGLDDALQHYYEVIADTSDNPEHFRKMHPKDNFVNSLDQTTPMYAPGTFERHVDEQIHPSRTAHWTGEHDETQHGIDHDHYGDGSMSWERIYHDRENEVPSHHDLISEYHEGESMPGLDDLHIMAVHVEPYGD